MPGVSESASDPGHLMGVGPATGHIVGHIVGPATGGHIVGHITGVVSATMAANGKKTKRSNMRNIN